MRILIIEDEKDIVRFLELELQHEGYETECAYNGRDGLNMALEREYDIILLDVMLPGLNGIEVLRRLRQAKFVPVILLTARDAVMDKVTGLDMGANDYITKPFHIEELLARIRVLTRSEPMPSEIKVCDLVLTSLSHSVTRDGVELQLTKKEYDLLAYFMRNHDIVLTREQLLNEVWGYEYFGDSNIVDVYVRYVRAKVNKGFMHKHIETVRGTGYVLRGKT
jgi:two-component system response regulator ArlR